MNNGAAELRDGRRDAGRCHGESGDSVEVRLSAGKTHAWRSHAEIRHPKRAKLAVWVSARRLGWLENSRSGFDGWCQAPLAAPKQCAGTVTQ